MQRKPPSRGEEKHLAHVLIKYHVKPSAHEDFLDAWNKVEKATGACMLVPMGCTRPGQQHLLPVAATYCQVPRQALSTNRNFRME